MKKLFGLGKGLNSLIPSGNKNIKPSEARESVFYVETHKIKPNPKQPRKDFEKSGLEELAASIKKYGILQPLLVSKEERDTSRGLEVQYELVAGERRWRAARLLNLPQVPVIIKDYLGEDKLKLELALVENLQREDLNPMEEMEAFARLQKDFNLTQKEIGERVGKSREAVANSLRLLELPSDIKESLRAGKISRTHARALLAFKDEVKQREIYKQILSGKLVTKETEQAAADHSGKKNKKTDSRFKELEKNLSGTLGTLVFVKNSDKGGRIVIKFADLEELNKIVKNILD
ncbi:MAG: ParB/RepB/Spo0J family partition protein [Candidatus Yanofskybacteria bacterium]|nr:ParB/RepB/Spo0J family partition protein [Candidatus Yanofskybacteria bacterium]